MVFESNFVITDKINGNVIHAYVVFMLYYIMNHSVSSFHKHNMHCHQQCLKCSSNNISSIVCAYRDMEERRSRGGGGQKSR